MKTKSSQELGTPLHVYGISSGVWLHLVFAIILLAAALRGYVRVLLGMSPTRLNGPLFWYLFSTVLGAIFLSVWLWQRTRRVQIFKHGFQYQLGARMITIRWEEVAYIWRQGVRYSINFIPVGTAHTFIIQNRSGEKIKLTGSIGRVADLGKEIELASAPLIMKQTYEQLQSGHTVDFGALQINSLGLHKGKMLLPWNEIKEVTTKNGYLIIKRQGQWQAWAKTSIAQTANIFILLMVIDQARQSIRQGS